MVRFVDFDQGSPEWLAWRDEGIGASELPIILGISPYCTPYKLWQRKMKFEEDQISTKAMEKGNELEPYVRETINMTQKFSFEPVCCVHQDLDWALASLDGIDTEKKCILEVKYNNAAKHKDVKRGLIPAIHKPQVQWQLYVTGYEKGIYASTDGEEIITKEFKRDDDYITETLIPAATEFYRSLKEYDPPEDETFVEITDQEYLEIVPEWKEVNSLKKLYTLKEKQVRERLIAFTDDGNCRGGGIRLTRICRSTMDWNAFYDKLIEDHPELRDEYNIEDFKKAQIGYWKIDVEKE